jgi:hypothetical protein
MRADLTMLSPAKEIKKGDTFASYDAYIYLARSKTNENHEVVCNPDFWKSCATVFAGTIQTVRVVEVEGLFNEITLKIDGSNVSIAHVLLPTNQAFPEPIEPTVSGDFFVTILEIGGPTVGQTMTFSGYGN